MFCVSCGKNICCFKHLGAKFKHSFLICFSVEQFTNSLIKSNCRRQSCCHELFGFDIMLDDRLRAWLLEVNISPRLVLYRQEEEQIVPIT